MTQLTADPIPGSVVPSATTLSADIDRQAFADAVREWFARSARDLPWRRPETTPWQVLVSEFMLQQTQVDRVVPKYEAWIARWPSPAALAAASPADAVRMWDRLGYPRRALWLRQAAQQIVDSFDGSVPRDPEALESITGVGPYTARAVSVFAFGERHPVVDTNTRRVLTRAVTGVAAAGKPSSRDLQVLAPLLPEDASASVTVNAGLMELGAVVCTARSPRCDECPIRRWCAWQLAGAPENAPAKQRTQATFRGSDREARGKILALLRTASAPVSVAAALDAASSDRAQAERAFDSLTRDGLITAGDGGVTLPEG